MPILRAHRCDRPDRSPPDKKSFRAISALLASGLPCLCSRRTTWRKLPRLHAATMAQTDIDGNVLEVLNIVSDCPHALQLGLRVSCEFTRFCRQCLVR